MEIICALKSGQFILIKRGRRQGEGLYDSCNIMRHSWWTPTTEIQFRKTNANKRKDTHTHIGIHADKHMQKHLQENTKRIWEIRFDIQEEIYLCIYPLFIQIYSPMYVQTLIIDMEKRLNVSDVNSMTACFRSDPKKKWIDFRQLFDNFYF